MATFSHVSLVKNDIRHHCLPQCNHCNVSFDMVGKERCGTRVLILPSFQGPDSSVSVDAKNWRRQRSQSNSPKIWTGSTPIKLYKDWNRSATTFRRANRQRRFPRRLTFSHAAAGLGCRSTSFLDNHSPPIRVPFQFSGKAAHFCSRSSRSTVFRRYLDNHWPILSSVFWTDATPLITDKGRKRSAARISDSSLNSHSGTPDLIHYLKPSVMDNCTHCIHFAGVSALQITWCAIFEHFFVAVLKRRRLDLTLFTQGPNLHQRRSTHC
jgi:hypothetical protein